VTAPDRDNLAEYEVELDAKPVTGLSILKGVAYLMPSTSAQAAFCEALVECREIARRNLKGSRAYRQIFGDDESEPIAKCHETPGDDDHGATSRLEADVARMVREGRKNWSDQ
jgi:hypothetical protein